MIAKQNEIMITKYLFSKASKRRVPLSGTFELSPVCNMNCKMCYIKMTKEEVSKKGRLRTKDEWLALAKQCRDEGVLYLLLTGGEPLLYDGFKELYLELKKMGFIISINTNGTLIDKDMAEWFAENPPSRVNITLYGASNETYEKLCNNPKGFDQVSNAIKYLKDVGIFVKINASMTPYNICDLDKIYKFADDNELIIQSSSYMFPPMRRDENLIGNGARFTSQECAHYIVKQDLMRMSEENFLKKAKLAVDGVFEYKINSKCDGIEDEGMKCRAGKSSFWITWNGEMTPCGMMNSPSSNVFENGFKKSWNYIVKKVEEIKIYSGCKSCEYKDACSKCAAMILTETGDFDKRPDYICEMTKYAIEETKRVYNEITCK